MSFESQKIKILARKKNYSGRNCSIRLLEGEANEILQYFGFVHTSGLYSGFVLDCLRSKRSPRSVVYCNFTITQKNQCKWTKTTKNQVNELNESQKKIIFLKKSFKNLVFESQSDEQVRREGWSKARAAPDLLPRSII